MKMKCAVGGQGVWGWRCQVSLGRKGGRRQKGFCRIALTFKRLCPPVSLIPEATETEREDLSPLSGGRTGKGS